MNKGSLTLLRKLTEAHGASGGEAGVRAVLRAELGAPARTDRQGSFIYEVAGGARAPRVMLTAHMDEVGFMVQSITANGYLNFVTLGGWWGHTLLSQRVRVLTADGTAILGVIASTPVHLLKPEERKVVVETEKMVIDVGARSHEEATTTFGIAIGDTIVPESTFTPLHDERLLMGKAFDNRAGVGIMIEVVRKLSDGRHPNQVLAVATVQEEVGTRGAMTAVQSVAPDVAIVLEGAPADDLPDSNEQLCQCRLGCGPQIRLFDPSAIMNRPLAMLARQTGERCNIPTQLAVRRTGGTDAKVLQTDREGVPCLVIAVPARYIHTHNSIIHSDDYTDCVRLVTELIGQLDHQQVQRLHEFQ